jgi:hypothetical protein
LIDRSELLSLPSSERKPRLLVAYFSYTGNTRRVAQTLTEQLRTSCNIETLEIVPRRKRSYLHWLTYSFVPDSEVEIENPKMELSTYDGVLLGFPKWTFSCPPLNRFIRKLSGFAVPKFFLFMTCGGFDAERFLRSFSRKLTRIGCNVVGSLTIKRRQIFEEDYKTPVESFARRVEKQLQLPQEDAPV